MSLHFVPTARTSSNLLMMPDIPVWWILGAGVILSTWWTTRVFGAGINAEVFIKVVQRLVRDKNITRALKLTTAAGDAPLGTAIRAALLASVSREDEANRPAGYRGNRPVSMDSVQTRIRNRYDAAFSTQATPLVMPFFLALLTLLLFGVAAFLAFSLPVPDLKVAGAAGIGVLAWIYVGSRHLQILSTRNSAFEALWPSFEAVYHDRHALSLDDKPAYPWPKPESEPNPEITVPQITFEVLEPGKPLRTVSFAQPIIKIGRLSTSHLQIEAEGVARMHAVVEIADGKATIIDLGAAKQTTVNLEPINKRELENGDVIGIGPAELVVRLGLIPEANG